MMRNKTKKKRICEQQQQKERKKMLTKNVKKYISIYEGIVQMCLECVELGYMQVYHAITGTAHTHTQLKTIITT